MRSHHMALSLPGGRGQGEGGINHAWSRPLTPSGSPSPSREGEGGGEGRVSHTRSRPLTPPSPRRGEGFGIFLSLPGGRGQGEGGVNHSRTRPLTLPSPQRGEGVT